MTKTDANPPMPEWSSEYQLVEVDTAYLSKAVKPKQFIHIDQSECIMCEGCVDICPWKCIHMVTPDAIAEAKGPKCPVPIHRQGLFIMTMMSAPVARCVWIVAQRGLSASANWGNPGLPAICICAPTTTAMPTDCASKENDSWPKLSKKLPTSP